MALRTSHPLSCHIIKMLMLPPRRPHPHRPVLPVPRAHRMVELPTQALVETPALDQLRIPLAQALINHLLRHREQMALILNLLSLELRLPALKIPNSPLI